ncbi:MAG: TSUP family transporter [Alphaproteobacteria bacterium]|jgi:uncharacterized membrane protein YfcA|nr:TSUP family transporter [Alphaproteobacteria bacterium]
MGPGDWGTVVAAYCLAAFVKGITGLGFATTCVPILALVFGVPATLPLVLIPSLVSNLLVMREAGHFSETLHRFWPLYLATLPGIGIGLMLLVHVEAALAAVVLGIVLIGYAAYTLARPDLLVPAGAQRPLAPAVGLLTGAVNGLTGSQVMPVLPYLLGLGLDPQRFVQAINISFTLSSLAMVAGLSGLGLMTVETALVSAFGLVPVVLGVALGVRVRRLLAPDAFRRMVLAFLMVLGVLLIGRAIA